MVAVVVLEEAPCSACPVARARRGGSGICLSGCDRPEPPPTMVHNIAGIASRIDVTARADGWRKGVPLPESQPCAMMGPPAIVRHASLARVAQCDV